MRICTTLAAMTALSVNATQAESPAPFTAGIYDLDMRVTKNSVPGCAGAERSAARSVFVYPGPGRPGAMLYWVHWDNALITQIYRDAVRGDAPAAGSASWSGEMVSAALPAGGEPIVKTFSFHFDAIDGNSFRGTVHFRYVAQQGTCDQDLTFAAVRTGPN
jgi:hypothetical protein